MKNDVIGKYELKIHHTRTWESSFLAEMSKQTPLSVFSPPRNISRQPSKKHLSLKAKTLFS